MSTLRELKDGLIKVKQIQTTESTDIQANLANSVNEILNIALT